MFQNKFKAFPNPAENSFHIKFHDTNDFINLNIINALGKSIWFKDYTNTYQIEFKTIHF